VLTLGFSGRILVAVESVDGRKGIDSLAGVVRSVLHGDPISGDLFVFKNRRGDKLKILAWMGDGFALYLRRLERGTFAFPTASDASVLVTPTQLAMILGGLDPAKARARLLELAKGALEARLTRKTAVTCKRLEGRK
jgi:transposase